MSRAQGFRLDMSAESGVVICTECGWRSFAFGRVAAWRAASAHEKRAHPGRLLASKALAAATARTRHTG